MLLHNFSILDMTIGLMVSHSLIHSFGSTKSNLWIVIFHLGTNCASFVVACACNVHCHCVCLEMVKHLGLVKSSLLQCEMCRLILHFALFHLLTLSIAHTQRLCPSPQTMITIGFVSQIIPIFISGCHKYNFAKWWVG